MSGLYAADGSYNVTVVSGATYTGLYAADGSLNVVQDTGSVYKGLYNPCGAYNVVYVTTPVGTGPLPLYGPNGDWQVSTTPYTAGGKPVTVVSGSFSGGGSIFLQSDMSKTTSE